eukprot:TRINITY_DN13865_c0_g1_i6.p1 TRINITY_DN13865_c0_g1~~TRINITY_DN13865_c0_g1_i6.p1  ORF type:complete len:414 (+),score=90.74 TRINITY_DN13865_c0_g1_i6:154-1395(+)
MCIRDRTNIGRAMVGDVIKFRNCRILRGGQVITDNLWVQDGKVIDPEKRFWEAKAERQFAADRVVDCHGLLIAPGYIDIQLNGAFGVDFTCADLTPEQLDTVAAGVLQQGVTSFCPTVVTSSPEVYRRVLPLLGPRKGSAAASGILGVHLEGPFISECKYGAHDKTLIRHPDQGGQSLSAMYGSEFERCAKIVTIAPELPGALDAIAAMSEVGIVASLGHSAADLDVATNGVRHGATLITHLFNAMNPFHHRDPGIVGLLGATDHGAEDGVFFGLIVDGIHCHPASVRMAHKASPAGVVLVTDAMMAMGLSPGEYPLGTMQVEITDRAYIAGTTTLAGSIAKMDSCVRRFREDTGCSIVEALEAASLHPAQVLGVAPQKGTLEFGADADLIFLDDQLNVQACYVGGELAWSEF